MEINSKKTFLINFLFYAVWGAIIFFTVKFLFSYLLPIVFAVAIAFLVQKPSCFISRKIRIKKGIAAIILTLLSFAIIVSVIILAFIGVYKFAEVFFKESPRFIGQISEFFKNAYESFKVRFDDMPPVISRFFDSSINSLMNISGEFLSSKISYFATGLARNTPMFIVTWIATIAIGCYIAKDFEKLGAFFKDIISKNYLNKLSKLKNIFVNSVLKIAAGYLIIMLITLVMLWISFAILGINNSFIVALITSVIDLLPVLGAGLVIIPWAVFSFCLGNVFVGMGLLLTYIVILISRNFLEPKIISKQIGINPLLTLLAIFIGLKVAGVGGMILAPLILVIFIKYHKTDY